MGLEIQWPLVIFSLLAGMGGCLMVPVAVTELAGKGANDKTHACASIVSLVLLVVGGCASLFHLESPSRVMAAVTNIGSLSGISIELILLGVTFIAVLCYLVTKKREAGKTALKTIATISMILGLLLAFFCGHGYMMESRALWNVELLPLAYLGSSLACGVFLFYLIKLFVKDNEDTGKSGRILALVSGVVCALCCGGYAIYLGGDAAFGEAAAMYWIGLVACGILGVLICSLVPYFAKSAAPSTAVAAISFCVAIVAGLGVRIVMWQCGEGFLDLFDLAAQSSYWVF